MTMWVCAHSYRNTDLTHPLSMHSIVCVWEKVSSCTPTPGLWGRTCLSCGSGDPASKIKVLYLPSREGSRVCRLQHPFLIHILTWLCWVTHQPSWSGEFVSKQWFDIWWAALILVKPNICASTSLAPITACCKLKVIFKTKVQFWGQWKCC